MWRLYRWSCLQDNLLHRTKLKRWQGWQHLTAMSCLNATYGTRDVSAYFRYILRTSVLSVPTTLTKSSCNSRPGWTIMSAWVKQSFSLFGMGKTVTSSGCGRLCRDLGHAYPSRPRFNSLLICTMSSLASSRVLLTNLSPNSRGMILAVCGST